MGTGWPCNGIGFVGVAVMSDMAEPRPLMSDMGVGVALGVACII
jgi:hypothetical protein